MYVIQLELNYCIVWNWDAVYEKVFMKQELKKLLRHTVFLKRWSMLQSNNTNIYFYIYNNTTSGLL